MNGQGWRAVKVADVRLGARARNALRRRFGEEATLGDVEDRLVLVGEWRGLRGFGRHSLHEVMESIEVHKRKFAAPPGPGELERAGKPLLAPRLADRALRDLMPVVEALARHVAAHDRIASDDAVGHLVAAINAFRAVPARSPAIRAHANWLAENDRRGTETADGKGERCDVP